MTYRQQLPGIDGKKSLRPGPKAGSNPASKVSTPADVGSVGPKVQIRGHLMERHSAREAIPVKSEDNPETTPPGSKDPTDPKSGGVRSGVTASAGGPLEPDGTGTTTSPVATATRWLAGRRNSPAVNQSLETRSGDGEATKVCVSMTTQRYWTT